MKILLTSDSHRDVDYLYNTIVKENPDMVIFAGDHSDDAIDISYGFDIPFYIVRGNCDYYDNMTKDIIELEIEEVGKILLTHGHLFSVKSTMNDIYKLGVEKNATFVVFGHTHIQHDSSFNGTRFINPGAIVNHEYAIYENGKILFKGGR